MKKIMFNDRYGLTQAVLEGRKTQTRRIAYTAGRWRDIMVRQDLEGVNKGKACLFGDGILLAKSAYKLGETIAIAQKYEDLRKDNEFYRLCGKNGMPLECIKYEKGCSNKMFVRADLMPHHIRITNIRVERLQDISEEDCMAEGIRRFGKEYVRLKKEYCYTCQNYAVTDFYSFSTPREAYAALIDKISGKGTWESNPWVFVYDFELIK
nr:MAG TPA: ASCH domain protein [Caudoviricetes sp.]